MYVLFAGDEGAPGNYGMFDQVLALKWVQRNIEGKTSRQCLIQQRPGGTP